MPTFSSLTVSDLNYLIELSQLYSASTMCFRPKAGSMTEMRGRKAFTHISREIIELCECIYDVGMHQKDPDDDSGEIIVTFGELFAVSISSYYGELIKSRIWLSCWGTTRR